MYPAYDLVYVEDDPTDARFFERAIAKADPGVRTHRFSDGQAAVDFVEAVAANRDPLPKVLVLDIKLPKLLGFDVLRAIRDNERTRHLPVVMLSGSTQQADIDLAYALGATSYINKPPTLKQLNETVGTIVKFWVRANRLPVGAEAST